MARTLAKIGVLLATSALVAVAASEDRAADSVARGVMFFQPEGCCNEWDGEHHGCCCCHKAPEITVHVVQPPPTFIYDVTHTACYTEHHDCCGCPYVCGPTCIPQGEVLAPANVGRKVAVYDCSKAKRRHHAKD
ncbi:hypothetical protein GGI25_001641 [Coemansia spiralis]|uniref:Uncharacterized protein n=2 Tax=Coemansia TaxID=4863 RepID=A0A9W8GBT7_9FUNG|nr:hypothetical protein EDC05_003331 [Coemansia umbellata]KAJ2623928.1 hypothetical protein GGI26_001943 [Coemansia sp. RSA 1358]KAJ2679285.1 hypothetical protein GGI25_001641 [Coemansia spiralis]